MTLLDFIEVALVKFILVRPAIKFILHALLCEIAMEFGGALVGLTGHVGQPLVEVSL